MSAEESPKAQGISIICVYNAPDVRQECLDRSIERYSGPVEVDFIPVDNTTHAFTSAGAALNHGARQARHDLVVFVHQDVYLHSIERLAVAGAALRDGTWGLLGANGVTSAGESVGRMRDRAQIIGGHAHAPVEVDSVDEVLFMVPRRLVLDYPLSEDADLAWHAYAVEYGLRLRQLGHRVGAVDLAITHNSLTTNLAKLDVAHRGVGARYPHLRPIRTTCGTVGTRDSNWRELPVIRNHRWRLRWLRQSLVAAKIRRRFNAHVVLSDIRHELDLLPFSDESPLHLINIDRNSGFAEFAETPLRFTRYDQPIIMRAVSTVAEMIQAVNNLPCSSRILVVDVNLDDLAVIKRCDDHGRQWLIGIQPGGLWMLGGTEVNEIPSEWSRRQAVPLGSCRQRAVPGEAALARSTT